MEEYIYIYDAFHAELDQFGEIENEIFAPNASIGYREHPKKIFFFLDKPFRFYGPYSVQIWPKCEFEPFFGEKSRVS